MVINVGEHYDDGLLPDIILLTLCDYMGNPFNTMYLVELLSLQPMFPLSYFQHAHFVPIVGVGKERRTLIGPW